MNHASLRLIRSPLKCRESIFVGYVLQPMSSKTEALS